MVNTSPNTEYPPILRSTSRLGPGTPSGRSAGASDQEANKAAVLPIQSVLSLPRKEASAEAVNAGAGATRYHSEWFWEGLAKLKGTAD
jgi:hypothetical protein